MFIFYLSEKTNLYHSKQLSPRKSEHGLSEENQKAETAEGESSEAETKCKYWLHSPSSLAPQEDKEIPLSLSSSLMVPLVPTNI